jgi:uncharacterized protein (DUF1330 family)
MKVIGLIKVLNQEAFDAYRSQVGQTVAPYQGRVVFRGKQKFMPWNELQINEFDDCVELDFPSLEDAKRWAVSPEYAALLPVRSEAMSVTLFAVES